MYIQEAENSMNNNDYTDLEVALESIIGVRAADITHECAGIRVDWVDGTVEGQEQVHNAVSRALGMGWELDWARCGADENGEYLCYVPA